MGHGSKRIAYEVYGNDVEGLGEDADKIWNILAMTTVACEKENLHFHYRDWGKSQGKLKAQNAQLFNFNA
jgi:hypothetical protein